MFFKFSKVDKSVTDFCVCFGGNGMKMSYVLSYMKSFIFLIVKKAITIMPQVVSFLPVNYLNKWQREQERSIKGLQLQEKSCTLAAITAEPVVLSRHTTKHNNNLNNGGLFNGNYNVMHTMTTHIQRIVAE